MPVDVNLPNEGMIYQREQYQKGGIGRRYWDYRDEKILGCIGLEKEIVDIGCGEGILLEKLIQRFPDAKVSGIDPSPENVSICRKHGLDVYAGSAYELPLESASVDCVLFIEVIEHLKHPELAIREIHRILKKDGRLVLLFPQDSIFKLARLLTFKFKEAFYDAGHVKQWYPTEMIEFLRLASFETIYKRNLPFHLWLISLHCLIVARKI